MAWVAAVLGVYGAAVTTALGYLTWRRDRHAIRFFAAYQRSSDWRGLVLNVVNVGFRPVTLHDAWFDQADGGGYLPDLDENLGLPRRLEEGDQLALRFEIDDIEPDAAALLVRDTFRREHRFELTEEVRQELHRLRISV